MYLRIVKVRSSNGTVNEYVRAVESYREDGKVKQRVVADFHPVLTMMLGLVGVRSILSDRAGGVDVHGSHDDDFARPHSGQSLQLDHRPDLAGDVGSDRVHDVIADWLDRPALAGVAPPLFQPIDRLQPVMDRGRDLLVGNRPVEKADDLLCLPVDLASAESRIDELLAYCLERQRTEFLGRCAAVELAQRAQSVPDLFNLRCRLAVLPIVFLDVAPVFQDQFGDGQIVGARLGPLVSRGRDDPLDGVLGE
jgi:hypothetical protein